MIDARASLSLAVELRFCGINAPEARIAYADGFVIPIPKKHVAAYQRMAPQAGKIWREHALWSSGNASATT